ncbi:N-acetylneuraminate synthase family protein [Rubritalea spongiae]|uniref:N-acetylneuraminate synthase family protein n=1 Tax=Rubritalea spongiae TaxID=430797 RepID=A0ABW5E3I1_9BACT
MENISPTLQNIVSKYQGKPIFVIGKGPSLDAIDTSALPEGLIINLNDSERIVPGDVAIFSANWVRHSLQEHGFRSGYYLAGKPLPEEVSHEVLAPTPIELDHEDMNVLRLEKEEFFDESFVLLNAIKLALLAQKDAAEPLDVYFLGFDFSTQAASQTTKAGTDWSGTNANERAAIIAAQEHEFKQFVHYFEKADRLRLHHVGEASYSEFTPVAFNRTICGVGAPLASGPIDLKDPDRVLVVAEFTNNHLGDPERLVEMIERAKEAGADLIKVQKRDVDSFYTEEQLNSYYYSPFGKTLGDYRRGVELNDEMLELLDATCKKHDIEWFCSILDYPSYEALKRFNPRLIKIPSTISNHRDYQKALSEDYTGAVVVSTGYTEQEYVDHVMDTYKHNEAVYLLHCISAYPTPREACNIAVVGEYNALAREDKRIIPGYSSHDIGSVGCMLAVASGAKMLEKHVKLGDVDWVHFDKVALDLRTNEFAKFIQDVRIAEEMVGSGEKKILDCEHHKYAVKS